MLQTPFKLPCSRSARLHTIVQRARATPSSRFHCWVSGLMCQGVGLSQWDSIASTFSGHQASSQPGGPKSRSTLGLHNLHHMSIRVHNWGVLLFGSSQGLGKEGASVPDRWLSLLPCNWACSERWNMTVLNAWETVEVRMEDSMFPTSWSLLPASGLLGGEGHG